MTHHELYKQIGIDPPRGVLLYGPPGTGKTMLAKAVAHHTTAAFIRVVGSEFVQKYLGEVRFNFTFPIDFLTNNLCEEEIIRERKMVGKKLIGKGLRNICLISIPMERRKEVELSVHIIFRGKEEQRET